MAASSPPNVTDGRKFAKKMPHDTAGFSPYEAPGFQGGMILLLRSLRFAVTAGALAVLALLPGGCAPDYSPNTYSGNAVQQANKVEPAIIIGFRQVAISANGTVGAVSGGAAGGVLGAQAGSGGIVTALSGVGGAVVGSLVGTSIEHATSDTTGWEYIVRKPNGELLSVTQREPNPIPLGQKVLVITGNQARIVPDYSTPPPEPPAAEKTAPEKAAPEKTTNVKPPAAEKQPEAEAKPMPITPAADTVPKPTEEKTPEKMPSEAASPPPSAPAADPQPAAGSEPEKAAPPANAAPPDQSD